MRGFIGSTTSVIAVSEEVKYFKGRRLNLGGSEQVESVPMLVDLAIRAISANFVSAPHVLESIPPKQVPLVTAHLPVDLPVELASAYVHDENYWKRCCLEGKGWRNCQIAEHGLTWKQLYFEKSLQEELENFDPTVHDFEPLQKRIEASQDYVFQLSVNQLLSHLDLHQLVQVLPNLTRLNLTYGVRKIGMKYERALFGMKISDASSLARCVKGASAITTLCLPCNLLDDDLLRMLMTGLLANNTITALDLSHNKITNHGARLLAKMLGPKSVLTSLSLCDNQIHAEGGRQLGRALRRNESLSELDLRLNRLTDEGGRMLFDGIRENSTPVHEAAAITKLTFALRPPPLSPPQAVFTQRQLQLVGLGERSLLCLRST